MLKERQFYNEYYDMQHIYDELYAQRNGNNFILLEIIGSEQTSAIGIPKFKTNSGSKTAGTDGLTIDEITFV